MAAHETQVPETRSPPHDQSTAPALNRRKRCRCGILPDHKTALEHREDGEAGKRTAATALNRGKRCRCGGGRMVVWGRMENLPRSGMPPVTAEVALGEVSCYPGVFLTYITCINTYACSMSDVLVWETAIGHPDMWSACNRHAP